MTPYATVCYHYTPSADKNQDKYKKIIFVLKNIRIPIRSGLIIKEEIK